MPEATPQSARMRYEASRLHSPSLLRRRALTDGGIDRMKITIVLVEKNQKACFCADVNASRQDTHDFNGPLRAGFVAQDPLGLVSFAGHFYLQSTSGSLPGPKQKEPSAGNIILSKLHDNRLRLKNTPSTTRQCGTTGRESWSSVTTVATL